MNWIISDVHGCYYTLVGLIQKVLNIDSAAKFVFVGDYTDRGKNNRAVIDFLITLQQQGAVCLRGNHDDVALFLLTGDQSIVCTNFSHFVNRNDEQSILKWWNLHGFKTVLSDYGVDWQSPDSLSQLRQNVPKEHVDFFKNLEIFWSNESHFACHGFFRPYQELPRDFKFVPSDLYEEVLWNRYLESPMGGLDVQGKIKWDKIGVFGHSPTLLYKSDVPIKWDKIRLIDTAVFKRNGYLAAYCCELDSWELQSTVIKDII